MRFDEFNIPWGSGIFQYTKRITFELSNLCNYAEKHKKCPVSQRSKITILPEHIFKAVINTCEQYDFQGVISFHMYNEPLIDPRLFLFMDLIRKIIPRAKIFIVTNGWYLDQNMAYDLEAHGLDYLHISAYSKADYLRFKKLKFTIPVRIFNYPLDNRLNWYSQTEKSLCTPTCYSPLYEICVNCNGKIVLCTYDWKSMHELGDLKHETLEVILKKEKPRDIYDSLSKGNRKYKLCRNCATYRGEAYK